MAIPIKTKVPILQSFHEKIYQRWALQSILLHFNVCLVAHWTCILMKVPLLLSQADLLDCLEGDTQWASVLPFDSSFVWSLSGHRLAQDAACKFDNQLPLATQN